MLYLLCKATNNQRLVQVLRELFRPLGRILL
nr:MAG TPA: hypothetical protein [Caudoviricetes sp.]